MAALSTHLQPAVEPRSARFPAHEHDRAAHDRRRRQGDRRRARHPLHPLLVHRHPRPAQVVLDQRGRARRRLRGRDGLRRLLDHRLQRDRGVRHDRDARRRRPSRCCPWRPDEQGVARMFCDILTPERTPYEGDPRHVLRRALERASAMGFDTFNVGPELEYFLFKDKNVDRGPRRGRLLRPHHARRRLRRAPRDGARARAARHPRRVHPPRGRAQPARDRHALRQRAEDGRRLHDLPHHGQGVRHEVRLACDVHAQAALRRERLGHAHPHEPVQRGQERDVRRRRRLLPLRRRQGVHRRPAQARARDLLDLRPVGELLQAPRARASRRRSTSRGRGATARRSCACRSTTRARSRRRAWSCAARTRRATRT